MTKDDLTNMIPAEELGRTFGNGRWMVYSMQACAMAAVLCVAVIYVMYREPPGTEYRIRVADPSTVAQGGTLNIRLLAARTKVCAPKVRRQLVSVTDPVNGTYDLPVPVTGTVDTMQRIGEYELPPVRVAIDEAFPLGAAEFRSWIWWRCNWVQALSENYIFLPVVHFTVVPKGTVVRKEAHR